MSDSPMRPAPSTAILRGSTIGGVYGGSGGVRRRADESCPICARAGNEPALEALEEEDAREPLPLGVGSKEVGGLAGLGPASAYGTQELHEPEVVDQPRVVAPEPLERHDSDRPRPDATLAFEAYERVVSSSQPFEVDRAGQPGERRGAARREPAGGEPCGREARECVPRRRVISAVP